MNWFEVVGVLAVVVSLMFVAYQIRQANRIAISTATIELQQMATDLVSTFLNQPDLADLGAKLAIRDHSLTPQEVQLAMAYSQKYLVIWDAVEVAYENGLISDRTFAIYDEMVEELVRRWPGTIPYMLEVLEPWGLTPENYKENEFLPEKSIHKTFMAKAVSLGYVSNNG